MIAWGGAPFGAVLGGLVADLADVRTAMTGATVLLAISLGLALSTGLRRRSFGRDEIR